jgi:hypothetical protein
MALTRTAAQLCEDLRYRADHLVGSFRDNARLRRYLSESCRSLVSQLVNEYEELYWCDEATVTTIADTQMSSLPVDAWKVVMMRVTLDGQRRAIAKAPVDAIDVEASSVGGWGGGGRVPRYRIIGRRIYWTPTPRAAHEVTLFYVPTAIFFDASGIPINELTSDSDYFDGVFGWEQVVVLDAAIKLLHDERKDSSALMQEWADRYAEVVASAQNQDATEPPRVRDTWRRDC